MLFLKKSPLVTCLLLALLQVLLPVLVNAQRQAGNESRIVAGDQLVLKVNQRPDLNRQLIVAPDGTVTMPLVGKVAVAGSTLTEARQKLFDALLRYYPSLTGIELTVEGPSGDVIYVIGQVGAPGKYSYTGSTNVWEAIREAGGAAPTASLDQVRVVKDLKNGGTTEVVNVADALESGTVDQLPLLDAGDTVIIPEQAPVYTGSSGVNVFGEVAKPGVYKLQGKQDLMTALLNAGGPTDRANLAEIKVIRPRGDGTTVTFQVDLRRFLNTGDPNANPSLKAGDSVNIPEQNQFTLIFSRQFLVVLTTAIALTTLIVNVSR